MPDGGNSALGYFFFCLFTSTHQIIQLISSFSTRLNYQKLTLPVICDQQAATAYCEDCVRPFLLQHHTTARFEHRAHIVVKVAYKLHVRSPPLSFSLSSEGTVQQWDRKSLAAVHRQADQGLNNWSVWVGTTAVPSLLAAQDDRRSGGANRSSQRAKR